MRAVVYAFLSTLGALFRSRLSPNPRTVHLQDRSRVVAFPELGGLHHHYERHCQVAGPRVQWPNEHADHPTAIVQRLPLSRRDHHCTWLYFRFALSYRDVTEMMAERGVTVSYETIREWSQKFGGTYAKRMRSKRHRLGDGWHLDEVFLTINGKLQYLWRAVDQDGDVLDILVQPRRNKKAAKKFLRKLLQGLQYVPRSIVTDKLRSYAAAKAEVMPSVEHQQQGRLNNRAENSHQPTRERERRMRGFKSPGHAQRFLSVFGVIASFFRPGRHLLAAKNYREIMRRRFIHWREIVGLQPAIRSATPFDSRPSYCLDKFSCEFRPQVDRTLLDQSIGLDR